MSTLRLRCASLICALGAYVAPSAAAQERQADSVSASSHRPDKPRRVDKTFFTRRDAKLTMFAVSGTIAIAPFDERIARWARTPSVQGSSSRRSTVDWLTKINETPLTIGAIATYGVGRLGRMKTVADIGLHVSEAMILTDVVSELIRGPIGRVRPRVANDDAFDFSIGAGFTQFDHRSFPSLHASSAFAAASSLAAEIGEHKPKAFWYAAPILYTAALIPGFTRVYLDQHWASDIVAGMFIGGLLGNKVVRYAHSHERSKLDRIFLGATIVPIQGGGFAVAMTLQP